MPPELPSVIALPEAEPPDRAATPAGRRAALLDSDDVFQQTQAVPSHASASRVAMLVLAGVVLASEDRSQPWVWAVVGLFGLGAVFNLWRVTTGRSRAQSGLFYFWASGFFVLVMARGTEGGALLLVLFLYPLTMCTVLHGLRHGLALGAIAAAGWLLSGDGPGPREAVQAGVLLLPPLIMSAISRPMAALRQRLDLAAALERELDPRRGLVAAGLAIGDRLRLATGARRVLVCHRDAESPTVLVCDADDGAFVASAALASRVLALLAALPSKPQVLQARDADLPATGRTALQELAQLLEAGHLQAVPDAPGQARCGWMLVAHGPEPERQRPGWPLQPLAGFAADLSRLLQQASYVDRLQEEIAAHERARIGRDLHDSALQPYLGLKFAIEGLALRSDPDNPLHAHVQELRNVCDAELVELRKTVAALRAGDAGSDNALAAALQRQCSRFARLFEIQVDLQVPAELPTSRTLGSALLHMVNEALNNVRRHTQARQVWIQLTESPGQLQLLVRDDAGRRSGRPTATFEPRSLAERAHELGGLLVLRHHDGLDTEIVITIPT